MPLILTVLSVLAVWAFLAVLVIALLLIFKILESVRGYLREVAMGVRAIEKETKPLGEYADALATTLADVSPVNEAERRIHDVVAALQVRS